MLDSGAVDQLNDIAINREEISESKEGQILIFIVVAYEQRWRCRTFTSTSSCLRNKCSGKLLISIHIRRYWLYLRIHFLGSIDLEFKIIRFYEQTLSSRLSIVKLALVSVVRTSNMTVRVFYIIPCALFDVQRHENDR